MKHNIDWSKSHNGVMLCSINKTIELMPEVEPILEEVRPMLQLPTGDYLVDVKIHMLMPRQYPCIPNWHQDFMPRGNEGKRIPLKCSDLKMYIWLSSEPLTEFKDKFSGEIYTYPAQCWHTFTQKDVHRGAMSDSHVWRCFIRLIPKTFVHSTTINVGELRRHTQVYLDSNNFRW